MYFSQKAPSAKRCIKTTRTMSFMFEVTGVRKHRAPKGALRRCTDDGAGGKLLWRQKVPSAKRCIKTVLYQTLKTPVECRQKAPSAKRCIKTWLPWLAAHGPESESTERQKVH